MRFLGPVVTIDNSEYPFTITNPFNQYQEELLEWYFKEYPRLPFVYQVEAQQAAASISNYGHALFEQVFVDSTAFRHYETLRKQGLSSLSFEIIGSANFQRYHWEAIKDPSLVEPLAFYAPFVRRILQPLSVRDTLQESSILNVLIITARPNRDHDIGYHAITRPLVETLYSTELIIRIHIVRPGSFTALTRHLEQTASQHGLGYYSIIHLDVHGGLRTYDTIKALTPGLYIDRCHQGRSVLSPYEGEQAFLFFESEKEGQHDAVTARELSDLLLYHQVPIAILNACESAKQLDQDESNFAGQMSKAGVPVVIALRYAVHKTAAVCMVQHLYAEIGAGQELITAIHHVRKQLYNNKGRHIYSDQTVDLEDWLLPIIYESHIVTPNVKTAKA